MATLWLGFAAGLTVFFLDWNKDTAWLRAYVAYDVPFMMMAFYLFLGCSALLVAVSLLSPHEHTAESEALVWRHPLDALRGQPWPGLGDYRLLSAILFLVMLLLYYGFS